ncbi:MAG: response regulator transcription factor NblR [Prochlorotrichaceae cyanobacterium]|jgi:OmpR family response regulator NblR
MVSEFNSVILIVESDENVAQSMGTDLYHGGYSSSWNPNAAKALEQLNTLQPDLVVINQTLEDESGLTLCYQMRQCGYRQAILLLMDQEDLNDRVQCLEAGADDYLVKPYRSSDLVRLVQIYLKPNLPSQDQLRFSDIVLDLGTRQVLRRNRVIDLTMKEFELLKYLMEHPREVLSREQILENVWGYDFMGESNVIEVYIRYLRLKIEDEGDKRLIQTVRGVGYVLRET